MSKNNRGQMVFWVVFAVAIIGLAALLAGGVYAPASQPQASNFTPFYPPSSSGALDFGGFGGNGGGGGGEVRGGGPFLECVIDFCVNPVTGRRVDENSPVRCAAPSKIVPCGSDDCIKAGKACFQRNSRSSESPGDLIIPENCPGGQWDFLTGICLDTTFNSPEGGPSGSSIGNCPYITQPDVICDGKWKINFETCSSECVRNSGGGGGGGGGCPAGSSYCDSDTTRWNANKQKCVAKSGNGEGGGGKTCGTTDPVTCSAGQVCVATIGGIVEYGKPRRIGFECSDKKIDDWLDYKSCSRNLTYGLAFDNADVVCAAP